MDCMNREGEGTLQENPECNGSNLENARNDNFPLTPPINIKTESAEANCCSSSSTEVKLSEMSAVKEELPLDYTLPDSNSYLLVDNSPLKGGNENVSSPTKKLESSCNSHETKVFLQFIKEEIDIEDVPQSLVKVEAIEVVASSNTSEFQCVNCSLSFLNQYIYKMHLKLCRANLPPPAPVTAADTVVKPRRQSYRAATTKKLIECVQNNPCLYDVDNEDFTNVDLQTLTWDNVAAECNLPSGAAAKSQWNTLKNRLINSITLVTHNSSQSSCAKIQRSCQYKKQLEFVLPYITDADIHTSMQNRAAAAVTEEQENETEVNNIDDDVEDDYTNDVQRLLRPKQISGSPQKDSGTSAKRKRKNTAERPETSCSQTQPLDMFFLSMCATTKNLPPYVQLQVKKKIFQAVIEAEEIVAAMHNDQAKNNMFHGAVASHDEYQNDLSPFSVHSNVPEEWQDD